MRLLPCIRAGLAATILVGAVSCAKPTPPPSDGVTLRVGLGTPKTSSDTGARGMINLLKGDPWVSLTADGHVAERIVTRWQWDKAATTLRLTLRPNVFFHDGTPITVEVAADTLRAQAIDEGAAFSLKSIRSIRSEGSDTVVVELTEPNSFLLTDLSATLVVKPKHPDIGTGPFRVIQRRGRDAARLEAFPQYYRGRPSLAGIDVSTYPTQRNAWSALMRGDIDMLYDVSRDAMDFVQAESTVKTYTFPRPYYIPLVFNVRRQIFKDARVRQAINMALDRVTLVRDGMNGRGTVADGPVSPQHWAYSAPATPFAYDPAAAGRLLDEAGFKARATPGSPVPFRFSFKCAVFANDPRFDRLEVLIQKQLADVGIEMQIVPVPMPDFAEHMAAGDFDAFVFEMAGRSLGWVYEFWRTHPKMPADTGYRGTDAVLDRIKGARTDAEVLAGVRELQRVLHDDPPAAFLTWQQQSRAVSTKFDVAAEDNRDILTNLWQWRPTAPK